MIEFTTVVGVDAQHLREWRLSWPTWRRHRPELLTRPLLAVCDADRPEGRWVEELGFLGHPDVTVVLWDLPNASQREKMLTGLTLAPAVHVSTKWFLKLDTDAVALAPGDWAPDAWFVPDCMGREPAFVAPSWGSTRSADWLWRLENWGDSAQPMNGRPRLGLGVPGVDSRVRHPRISSWCFFARSDWLREVTTGCSGRLPVPSHDTFLWYCAARRGDHFRPVRMEASGWSHGRGLGRLKRLCPALPAVPVGGAPAAPPHAARLAAVLRDLIPNCTTLRGAEIGVKAGDTSAALLREFAGLHLYMVDPWGSVAASLPYRASGDTVARWSAAEFAAARRRATDRTAFAADRRTLLDLASPGASAHVCDDSLDFGFIDGDHTYPAVRADLRAWWPKIRPGGVLAGHDYDHPRDRRGVWGVRRAVDEWAAEAGAAVRACRSTTVWWVQKPAAQARPPARVFYLLTGAGHAARLVASVWSLRRYYAGPVTVYTTQTASHLVGKRCAADPVLRVEHRTMPHPPFRRNSSLVAKVLLARNAPDPCGLFLDADTLVTGDLSPLLEALSEAPVVATHYRDWTSDVGRVRGRLETWRRLVPRHPNPPYLADLIAAATRPHPAINLGVFGWRRGADVLGPWEDLTRFGYRQFIPDEIALQLLLHRYPHRVLDSRFNWSPDAGPGEDVRVWHFHGRRHLRGRGGRAVWLPAFRACLADNPAGIVDWADLVEPALAAEVASHKAEGGLPL